MNSKAIYCDVVFPLRLDALTYIVPEGLREKIMPGCLVEAPLRKRIMRGVALRLRDNFDGDAQSIRDIITPVPFLREELLKLLEWMSGYYLTEEGTILRLMIPSLIFKKKLNLSYTRELSGSSSKGTYSSTLIMEDILKTGRLSSFLERADKGAIILVPSIDIAEKVYKDISGLYKERVLLFHSRLKASELHANYLKLLDDYCEPSPIVIGTRNAVFLPFRPSMIIVIDEVSNSYKQEESPSFNVRDIAVIRAYIEKIPVLLSSEHPSLESIYNVRTGKYKIIKKVQQKRRVSITINRLIKRGESELFPERLMKKIEDALRKNKKVLLSFPRAGYSYIRCRDCGKVLRCSCGGIFIYYKDKKYLKCRLCYHELKVSHLCPYCSGTGLEHFLSGIERIEEFIKERYKSFSMTDSTDGIIISSGSRFVTGEDFHLGVILDADIFLNIPDYRATERLFHEVYYLIEKIKEGGEIILQTRMPEYKIFDYIRRLDYIGFALSELKMRRQHMLPPFCRFIIIRIFSKKDIDEAHILERFKISGASLRKIDLKKRKKKKVFESAFLLRIKRNVPMETLRDIIRTLREDGLDVRCHMD